MSDIYFSCLGCNALYKDIYEIEAHLLHDPCHEDDTQALYDSYGTAEYLHVMLSKIQMLISQSAEEADASREGSVTTCTWEVEERQWEEEDEIYNMLCAGIQDDETPRPHEDQVNSITRTIDGLDFSVHTLGCVTLGVDCECPNGTHVSYPPSPEMEC